MRLSLNKIYLLLLIIVMPSLFFCSCDKGEVLKRKVEYISAKQDYNDYEYRLAAMSYIFKSGQDLEYSLKLVNFFIRDERYSEARNALEHLSVIHGEIPQIPYLKAVCFRNETMFEKANIEISKALSRDPENELFLKEQANISYDYDSWKEIQKIDDRIREEGKTPDLLYERGEKLVHSGYFEESFYDLNTLLERDAMVDDVYKLFLESLLYRKEYENADTLMKAWTKNTKNGLPESYLSTEENLVRLLSLKEVYLSGTFEQSDLISYARLLTGFGDFNEGDRVLIAGLKQYPNDYKLLYSRLLLNIEANRMDVARGIFQTMNSLGMRVDPKITNLLK